MTNRCDDARGLIPSYLDGELSEAQAAPLRKHLLDCQPCRQSAQGDKNLKRWFVDEGPVEVPAGFAARVARRAFAGDTGIDVDVSAPGAPLSTVSAPTDTAATRSEGRVLRFVLQATSIAAVVLVFLSVGLRSLTLPSSDRLMADDRAEIQLEEALRELDRLDREEILETPTDGDEAPEPAR